MYRANWAHSVQCLWGENSQLMVFRNSHIKQELKGIYFFHSNSNYWVGIRIKFKKQNKTESLLCHEPFFSCRVIDFFLWIATCVLTYIHVYICTCNLYNNQDTEQIHCPPKFMPHPYHLGITNLFSVLFAANFSGMSRYCIKH